MASTGSSRHMACKLCRDRKVRCPGEQPTCERCRQAGEKCVYLPMQRTNKANLNQTVEAMQTRLEEAETLILKMRAQPGNPMTASPGQSSSYGFDWPAYSSEFTASAPSSDQTPSSIVPSGGVDFSSGQLGHQDLIYQQLNMHLADSLRNKSLEPLQTTASQKATAAVTGRNDAAQFRVGEGMTFDKSSMGFYPQIGLPYQRKSHDQGQGTIGHVRHESTSSSRNTPAPPESTRNAVVMGSISEDAGAAILDPLSAFCSSVVRRQCEMSGVASAVADYVAWIRNIPQSGASPATSSVYKTMLENIEVRVRELIEIAEAGHPPSFREMLVALERSAPPGGAMASRLASLEQELQRQVHGHSHFFQTRYDACRPLSEQGRESPQ